MNNFASNTDFIEEVYPFITDDIFICARIDKKTSDQWLVLQKRDITIDKIIFEEKINCIHTIINNISVDDIQNDFNRNIRSKLSKFYRNTEKKEIILSIEEKFFALKSWVQGISEVGLRTLILLEEEEKYSLQTNPIFIRIFKFLLKAMPDLIYSYLELVERDGNKLGVKHDSFINANILALLNIIVLSKEEYNEEYKKWYNYDTEINLFLHRDFKEILPYIFEFQPNAYIFTEKRKLNFILLRSESKKLKNWNKIMKNAVTYRKQVILVETGLNNSDFSLNLSNFQIDNISKIRNIDSVLYITHLDLSYNKLISSKGLEKLINLTHLNLSNNAISRIESLSKLKNLRKLDFRNNHLQSIEGLGNLVKLEKLNLSHNQIYEINNLENLKSLKILKLNNNNIITLSGISHLSKLHSFSLFKNPLEKSSEIAYNLGVRISREYCTNPEILKSYKVEFKGKHYFCWKGKDNYDYLTFSGSNGINLSLKNMDIENIEDIEYLENITDLNLLDLSGNKIKTISNVKNPQINTLNLSNNFIKKIENLEFLSNLRNLSLDYNNIEKLENLDELNNLINFSMSNNKIRKLENLKNLKFLEILNLNNNDISEIEVPMGNIKLTHLLLEKNNINILNPFKHLKLLKFINISFNPVMISEFNNLPNGIEKLKAANCKLDKVPSITHLDALKILDLENNNIENIENLKNFLFLIELYLSYNKIRDITPIKNLNNLKRVYLEGNNVKYENNAEFFEKLDEYEI